MRSGADWSASVLACYCVRKAATGTVALQSAPVATATHRGSDTLSLIRIPAASPLALALPLPLPGLIRTLPLITALALSALAATALSPHLDFRSGHEAQLTISHYLLARFQSV